MAPWCATRATPRSLSDQSLARCEAVDNVADIRPSSQLKSVQSLLTVIDSIPKPGNVDSVVERDGLFGARHGAGASGLDIGGRDDDAVGRAVADLVELVHLRRMDCAHCVAGAASGVDADSHRDPEARGANTTGMLDQPPIIAQDGYSTGPPSVIAKSGTRSRTAAIISANSTRAKCEPGQRCLPIPKDTWRLGNRLG